ncbi:uncharacterized protein TEOVI_000363200 [Trypanosoma equiperdum]|uniref:Uncharacterized protein n=1 Tax=Trypanosoma equiperdum TaxID=5694 RepID=A0A1G4IIE2_TRYEQ|nr:hypothetical protein TEOVI_000363200 [Trypanosoma equiperdum]
MLTGAILHFIQPCTRKAAANDNCSTVEDADKYAEELIKATTRAYRQEKTAQTMLHQLQVYTALTNDAQMRRTLVPLSLLLSACAAAENAAAAALEKQAQTHILNIAQALGTQSALSAVAAAEIDAVTNTAHGNSAAYKKSNLRQAPKRSKPGTGR